MAYGERAGSWALLSTLGNEVLLAKKANTALRQKAKARIEHGSRF